MSSGRGSSVPRLNRRRITAALVGLLVLVGGGWLLRDLVADSPPGDLLGVESGLEVQRLSALPPEATQTWELIEAGGPFPERQDGTVFGNREGVLPAQERGYYREYTVPTPGLSHRGARRLVTGAGDELYYTGDHYQSFVVVDPNR
jgi:ribonuclease T1